ncbi:MAG: 1,4-alpha-glucan branching protein GlgB [Hymenobacteraceae bacterium]|nr:1,4-alpha-glucan branching protein GlgB [Hymenobacteraceae bacterium]MDX5396061.1 1,4-alpha-glucan branching protein GlgB [Hymenobacteraceae bacterium]MDX5512124.1 1,4-alpha-glucan branching protein GlgB [Hymenobacteraceae bacterium]
MAQKRTSKKESAAASTRKAKKAPEVEMAPPAVAAPEAAPAALPPVLPLSRFTEFDIYLFKEGRHYRLHDKLGAHLMQHENMLGTYFAVWAPNAEEVSVIGEFNHWQPHEHRLYARLDSSGIWEGFIPNIGHGALYKYHIRSRYNNYSVSKADPFAFYAETAPRTASVVWSLDYKWNDKKWGQTRKKQAQKPHPLSVYELHLGSWRRVPEEDCRPMTYRELANYLPKYVKELGFTHVEFLPVMEHPFYGSWGYQITGFFAATSRYGSPQDFMYLIDALHQEGIGVILDWVPSHFPSDEHGLVYFDGTHLFEHADPRKGFHPDWQSYIFNYGRSEVKSFLISNALFWLEKYHADGLRVDAVASMLYLDYSRKHGEWEPNIHGGRENLEAVQFLKDFNTAVHEAFPDVITVAEESTAWPMVSRPVEVGGLGFDMKWMMGWMHDTLKYLELDPVYRQHHQGQITFSIIYAFTENFMLPLSHDEVVHGKNALVRKFPGDDWQQFANLRTLYGYMFAHPGAKLLFMGGEIGQTHEWKHEGSLDWHLTEYPLHSGVQKLVKRLNELYCSEKALYDYNFVSEGFEWMDINDSANSVMSFIRKGKAPKDVLLVVCNFTPVPRENYRIGVPCKGNWEEVLNSDAAEFGGSNVLNPEPIQAEPMEMHNRSHSISLTLPPLGVVYLKNRR